MQRVLRWQVPVGTGWHDIGAGPVVLVDVRDYARKPGDLIEVWTLEQTADASFKGIEDLPRRSVTVVGTGHPMAEDTRHIGSAVVPTFGLVPSMLRGGKDTIEPRIGLVWHVFERYNPEAERQALAEQGRRLASVREDLIAQGHDPNELPVPLHPDPLPSAAPCSVPLIERTEQHLQQVHDEATNLSHWLAEQLSEHVADQNGETLTETVQRLMANRLADAHRALVEADGPQIGGFQRGHIVTIGTNGDKHEGETGVVATLDHDHGWRLWVRVGRDVHDQHAPALYLSPDDIDMVVVS